jgi:hypothetical protein
MSKTAIWGIVVSACFTIITAVAPIGDTLRRVLFIVFSVIFVCACIGWYCAHKAEKKNKEFMKPQRSKLILLEQGVSLNSQNEMYFFFQVKNVGIVPVKSAEFSFAIQTDRLEKPPIIKRELTSQPIADGVSRRITYTFPRVDPEPAYIAFQFSYNEVNNIKWDSDPVFFVWQGIKGNTMHFQLEFLPDKEIIRFVKYLRKYEDVPKLLLQDLIT